MKSLANDILYIVDGILADIRRAYPEYGGVGQDVDRLSLLVKTRGLGLFTLDLPSLDKILLDGLENGRLSLHGPLSTAVSRKIQVPRFLQGLWLRVFRPDSCLREDPDANAILFLRQIFCFGKKIRVGCSDTRHDAAVKEFINVERETRFPTLEWGSDSLDPNDYSHDLCLSDHLRSHCWFGQSVDRDGKPFQSVDDTKSDWALLKQCQSNADIVASILGEFDAGEFSELIHDEQRGIGHRHGPGAVSERKGVFHKYTFLSWPDKLHATFPFGKHGKIANAPCERPRNHEPPSLLIAVPKTAKSPRLIAAEPTEHQWCQQLLFRFIEERLKGSIGNYFVDFRSQERSRQMVLRASLDGRLATVDLSSASDRLSCWTVERMFRNNKSFLNALHASRTRSLKNPLCEGAPEHLLLKKFASQGTAVTFPVQTMVFFICAITACGIRLESELDLISSRKGGFQGKVVSKWGNQVRVFGDDIIIPRHGYGKLVRLLHLLGLKVNMEKSFHKGHFRESCGMDAFQGVCVTPVKPKSLSFDGPTSRDSLIALSNNLFEKGFWVATSRVESMAAKHPFWRLLPVVGRDSGVIGRVSYVGSDHTHLKSRWNVGLQRTEIRQWSFRSTVRRRPTNDYPGLLQYFCEAPNPIDKWEHGSQEKPRLRDGARWEVPA